MVARTWAGRTQPEHADEYTQYVLDTGIAGIRETPGNCGGWLLRREAGAHVEFLLISLWDSLESIRAFAGGDVEKARYYPEDDRYLLEKVECVDHYEVVHEVDTG